MSNFILPPQEECPIPIHPTWQVMDSTKLQSWAKCPRSFFYEYLLGWRPNRKSNHLVFGQAWHLALEHLYKHNFKPTECAPAYELFLECYRKDFPETTDEWFGGKTPDNALFALTEYVKKYQADPFEIKVLETEVDGVVDIGSNRTLSARLDLVGQQDGRIMALEHKTGSRGGETWARQWSNSIQIGTYIYALTSYFCKPQDLLPKVVVNGTFFHKSKREFLRVPCMRTIVAMEEWLATVHTILDEIQGEISKLVAEKGGGTQMRSFRMNPTSCTQYGCCQYFDLCTCTFHPIEAAQAGYIPDGFKVSWWNPLERGAA